MVLQTFVWVKNWSFFHVTILYYQVTASGNRLPPDLQAYRKEVEFAKPILRSQ
jgi:hypothetical protein